MFNAYSVFWIVVAAFFAGATFGSIVMWAFLLRQDGARLRESVPKRSP